jgi:hypothetical protein
MQSREEAMQNFHDVQQLLKLILNLVAGETEETQYFLQLAVKGILEKVLIWNDPRNLGTSYYSLDIDVIIMRIFLNLIRSKDCFEESE